MPLSGSQRGFQEQLSVCDFSAMMSVRRNSIARNQMNPKKARVKLSRDLTHCLKACQQAPRRVT